MERNVMGELNVYRGSGAKPNFSEIARRHGMDRHTVAKYWREGESAADGRSARGSAFDPLEEVIRAKAQLPGMTKMAVYAFLREGRGEGLPGYGAFTAWCRARCVSSTSRFTKQHPFVSHVSVKILHARASPWHQSFLLLQLPAHERVFDPVRLPVVGDEPAVVDDAVHHLSLIHI